METNLVIYWMKIYPLDNVIHLLNNLRRMTFELTTLFRATNHPDRSLGLASLWLKNAFTRVVLSVWAANRVINVWAFCDALTHRITSLRYLADTMEWALDWQTGIVRMLYLQQNKGKYEVIFTPQDNRPFETKSSYGATSGRKHFCCMMHNNRVTHISHVKEQLIIFSHLLGRHACKTSAHAQSLYFQ